MSDKEPEHNTPRSSPPGAGPVSSHGQQGANKWVITFSVMLGTFLSVMDVSVVNVAMPHMMGSFGATLSSITWVATSYSIAEIIMLTMSGWWTTLLGRKRLYLFSFFLFSLGSALAGTSRSLEQMIFFRILQGFGGGSLIPLSQAILRETFPAEEQGMAMAIYGMGVVVAPAFGPVVGGWLTEHYGWPWIFYLNIPFSIAGILMVHTFVEDPSYLRRGVEKIDRLGIGLLAVGITTMQVVLERGETENWFASKWITAGAVVAGLSFALLVIWELRSKEPIVNFRLFRNVPLSVGSAMGLISGVALYGSSFAVPALVQNLLGYPAFEAGLLLLPRAAMMFLLMPVIGALYNKVDARVLVSAGIGVTFLSYYQLGQLALNVSFWDIVTPMLIMGVGMPSIFVTMATVSLSTMPKRDMTSASSLYTLTRRVGGNIGYALAATLVDRYSTVHREQLIPHINALNPAFRNFQSGLVGALTHRGSDVVTAGQQALGIANLIVNQQSRMMAYNDLYLVFGLLFLLGVPLLFFLPGRKNHQTLAAGGHP